MYAYAYTRFETVSASRLLLITLRKLKKCHTFDVINAPLLLLVILSGKFIDKQ